jgi:hypothetical protein
MHTLASLLVECFSLLRKRINLATIPLVANTVEKTVLLVIWPITADIRKKRTPETEESSLLSHLRLLFNSTDHSLVVPTLCP